MIEYALMPDHRLTSYTVFWDKYQVLLVKPLYLL